MVLGKKVTIFDWEWDRNSPPRDWQKIPCANTIFQPNKFKCSYKCTLEYFYGLFTLL